MKGISKLVRRRPEVTAHEGDNVDELVQFPMRDTNPTKSPTASRQPGSLTRPYRPRTIGKAERFIQTIRLRTRFDRR